MFSAAAAAAAASASAAIAIVQNANVDIEFKYLQTVFSYLALHDGFPIQETTRAAPADKVH